LINLAFRTLFLLFLLVISAVQPTFATESTFKAFVVAVRDGDTISVLRDGAIRESIRLNAVDCPERKQAFGTKAKQYTASLCLRKEVTIVSFGQDRYHRTLGDVILPDGTHLNSQLVKAGYAWWYKKYAPENSELMALEENARKQKLGLWQAGGSIAPWDYRLLQKRIAAGAR
jgi:micrococcal nuclease